MPSLTSCCSPFLSLSEASRQRSSTSPPNEILTYPGHPQEEPGISTTPCFLASQWTNSESSWYLSGSFTHKYIAPSPPLTASLPNGDSASIRRSLFATRFSTWSVTHFGPISREWRASRWDIRAAQMGMLSWTLRSTCDNPSSSEGYAICIRSRKMAIRFKSCKPFPNELVLCQTVTSRYPRLWQVGTQDCKSR